MWRRRLFLASPAALQRQVQYSTREQQPRTRNSAAARLLLGNGLLPFKDGVFPPGFALHIHPTHSSSSSCYAAFLFLTHSLLVLIAAFTPALILLLVRPRSPGVVLRCIAAMPLCSTPIPSSASSIVLRADAFAPQNSIPQLATNTLHMHSKTLLAAVAGLAVVNAAPDALVTHNNIVGVSYKAVFPDVTKTSIRGYVASGDDASKDGTGVQLTVSLFGLPVGQAPFS